MTHQSWTPQDWLRLVALLGGFAIFAAGAWMLYLGISAEGVVDIKTTIASGTLKTASAGLFLCFFSFLVIALYLVTLPPATQQGVAPARSRQLFPVLWAVLALFVGCIGATAFLPDGARVAVILNP